MDATCSARMASTVSVMAVVGDPGFDSAKFVCGFEGMANGRIYNDLLLGWIQRIGRVGKFGRRREGYVVLWQWSRGRGLGEEEDSSRRGIECFHPMLTKDSRVEMGERKSELDLSKRKEKEKRT